MYYEPGVTPNGLDYTVVPYKGTAPAFQDLIGGQISGFIDPILGSRSTTRTACCAWWP